MVKKGQKKVETVYPDNQITNIKFAERNMFLTYSDSKFGNVILKRSVGCNKFKNSKKRSIFAYSVTARAFMNQLTDASVTSISRLNIKGYNRFSAIIIKILQQNLKIFSLYDKTPLKHGGCKASRPKRK